MTDFIDYEQRGFLKKAINVIKSGHALSILIQQKKHIKILKSELNIDTKNKVDEVVPSVKLIFFMLPFVTLHFYALASGYTVVFENDADKLNCNYRK